MAHVEKRGPGRWRARYRGPDGRERSQTFDRKLDAERWLVSQQSARQNGGWIDPVLGRLTFDKWADQWARSSARGLRPTTRELYAGVLRNYLRPRFGKWPLAGIGVADVKEMLSEELEAGMLSVSAVRRHVLVLSVVLAAAVEDGRISRNPCAGVKLPPENAREMRFLEPAEVVQLADAITVHYRPLVLTAAYVGLRWGELAGLRVDRIDVLRGRLRVDQQLVEVNGKLELGPPKTKAGVRTVTMPGALVDELIPHLDSRAVRASGLAFPTPSGQPMRRSNFRTVWARGLSSLGWVIERDPDSDEIITQHRLAGLVFHELRHTAAALAIAQSAHPLAIKERLGHSSITVTLDRYGGLFPHLDEQLAQGLDAVLRGSLAANPRPEGAHVVSLCR